MQKYRLKYFQFILILILILGGNLVALSPEVTLAQTLPKIEPRDQGLILDLDPQASHFIVQGFDGLKVNGEKNNVNEKGEVLGAMTYNPSTKPTIENGFNPPLWQLVLIGGLLVFNLILFLFWFTLRRKSQARNFRAGFASKRRVQ